MNAITRPLPPSAISLKDCVYGRRAVRDFLPDPVPREMLVSLVDAAIHAPSAMNAQDWLFTIITDRNLLDRIAREAKSFIREAMKSDPDPFHKTLLGSDDFHILYHAPALIVISAPSAEMWRRENCALAAQNLMLAAYAAGLGSCWIGFSQRWLSMPAGKLSIGLADTFEPVAPIIVGYPRSTAPAVPRNSPAIVWRD